LDGPLRGIRGGSFMGSASLRADNRGDDDPTNEINIIGFRVSQVPGPSSFALLAIGGATALRRTRSVAR
ncbi:MAG TPA: hypothetical protein VG797_10510, partial [Phycisphaerales bacterium]|nr:hypothetical protein [Phycisphaerales bacterium]